MRVSLNYASTKVKSGNGAAMSAIKQVLPGIKPLLIKENDYVGR